MHGLKTLSGLPEGSFALLVKGLKVLFQRTKGVVQLCENCRDLKELLNNFLAAFEGAEVIGLRAPGSASPQARRP